MKTIELTQGQVALVDDDDYERLNKHTWCAAWVPSTKSFYAVRNSKCDPVTGKQYHIYMAREIMHAQPGQQCDHKSHDTLDNRKVNLRLCTHGENQHNQKKQRRKTSSRYKGVCWYKQRRKWRAQIRYGGKMHHLGYFTNEEQAARAYDRAAIEHFGEFAHLNFPEEENQKRKDLLHGKDSP